MVIAGETSKTAPFPPRCFLPASRGRMQWARERGEERGMPIWRNKPANQEYFNKRHRAKQQQALDNAARSDFFRRRIRNGSCATTRRGACSLRQDAPSLRPSLGPSFGPSLGPSLGPSPATHRFRRRPYMVNCIGRVAAGSRVNMKGQSRDPNDLLNGQRRLSVVSIHADAASAIKLSIA